MAGPKITPQKSRGTPGTNKGFWQAEVMKVTATAEDPYLVFIKIDRLGVGINDPVPADYVGSPPRVGDVLWCTFIENNQDTYLIFNTQHQAGDDMTDGVVRFGGQTEATGVTGYRRDNLYFRGLVHLRPDRYPVQPVPHRPFQHHQWWFYDYSHGDARHLTSGHVYKESMDSTDR